MMAENEVNPQSETVHLGDGNGRYIEVPVRAYDRLVAFAVVLDSTPGTVFANGVELAISAGLKAKPKPPAEPTKRPK